MIKIAHASMDEKRKLSGGSPGDQTGKEVCIRDWYSRPWSHVLRIKKPVMREKVADAMERAANNPNIGYNQSRRNTLLTYARKDGYDPGKVKALCDTDCSALVSLACMYAGIPESTLYKNGNSSTTGNLRTRLKGYVEVLTGKEYTARPDKLLRGDILLYEGHHVAVVVDVGPRKSIHEVAVEVLDGKWGNGTERLKRLDEAGYDSSMVQEEVNRLCR